MQVREVMSRDIQAVPPDTSLSAAARKMRDSNVGALLVIDGGQLAGVVTDRDIIVRTLAEGLYGEGVTVRQAMTVELISCSETQTLDEAERLMAEHQVRRLPVQNRDGQVVGVLSRHDLPGAAASQVPYRVTFHKRLTTSQGQRHAVTLRSIYVSDCPSPEAAVAAAVARFEAENGGRRWTSLADGYEVSEPR